MTGGRKRRTFRVARTMVVTAHPAIEHRARPPRSMPFASPPGRRTGTVSRSPRGAELPELRNPAPQVRVILQTPERVLHSPTKPARGRWHGTDGIANAPSALARGHPSGPQAVQHRRDGSAGTRRRAAAPEDRASGARIRAPTESTQTKAASCRCSQRWEPKKPSTASWKRSRYSAASSGARSSGGHTIQKDR